MSALTDRIAAERAAIAAALRVYALYEARGIFGGGE